jgi:type II secretory pathway pseudopilin PulG
MRLFRLRKLPCSRGVTLIEIMLVIAIMMILMGLIMTVIGTVRKRAKESSTRLLLDGIMSNMSRYHMEFDDYPDSVGGYAKGSVEATGDDFADDGSIYLQMNSADGAGAWKAKDTPYQKRLEPFLKLQPENLRKQGTNFIVVDFFGRPIRYYNSAMYIRLKEAAAGSSDAAIQAARKAALQKVHNEKVDLWSLGDSLTNPEDDIKNWQ